MEFPRTKEGKRIWEFLRRSCDLEEGFESHNTSKIEADTVNELIEKEKKRKTQMRKMGIK